MIDALFKRKICREFIKSYSEELWKQVIPDVFEIGVLSLEKSFNKILFSKEEFKEILDDLRSDEYFKRYETKKIERISKKNVPQCNKEEKEEKKENNGVYPSWWGQDEDYEDEIEKQTRINKRKHKKHHHHHKRQYVPSSSNEDSVSDSYYDSHPMIMNRLRKTPTEQFIPANKTNYKISYDKNLKPESIEKKEKEQKYSYSTGRNGLQRTPSVERMRPPRKSTPPPQEEENVEQYDPQQYNVEYEEYNYNNNSNKEMSKSNHSDNPSNNIQQGLPPVREESNDDHTVSTNPNESNRPKPYKPQQVQYKQISKNKIPSNNIENYPSNSNENRNSQDMNYNQPLYQMDSNEFSHKQYISSQPLQTSNLSNHNEQLSMIEVDEGMKNLFRNKLNCQYDSSSGFNNNGNTYQMMN